MVIKQFKKLSLCLIVVMTTLIMGMSVCEAAKKAEPVYLGTSIRSLDNEYHQIWKKGGELFAKEMGLSEYHRTLLSEGNTEKQLDDIRALIAKAGKNVVFNVDPNEAPAARAVAEICEKAGVYFITQWNKPADLHPWDYKYWVTHITTDGVATGYAMGKLLCEAIGGKGKIAAIQGMLANTTAIERYNGLLKALKEYPTVELVDSRPADWLRDKGMTITEGWLVAYPDLAGIWAANDEEALGALEALKSAGLGGKIPVTGTDATGEAVRAVANGEMLATTSSDAYWQGGMGLSLAYQAYTGAINPEILPHELREWHFKFKVITQENAQKYIDEYITGTPTYDYEDIFGRWVSPIR